MSDSSLRDRYLELIDQIVQMTLKGMIRSKEQVYQMLVEGVSPGTGEFFERCLDDRLSTTQQQIATQASELKQAKATRSLRALQTIQGEWQRWQTQNQASQVLTAAVQQVVSATAEGRLNMFLRVIDPNRAQAFSLAQLQQLASLLQQQLQQSADDLSIASDNASDTETPQQLQQLSQGLVRGIESWQQLEDHLVSWMYDQNRSQLGFEGVPGQRGPWALWAKQVNSPLLQALFQALALERSPGEWAAQSNFELSAFVELVVVLRCLQFGLVSWFDKLVYDAKVGAKLSISTFLAFAVIWSQLANGFSRATSVHSSQSSFTDACFQITLQILRTFSQRDYFPLYGGVFASFSGGYLRDALSYLDEPLQRAEGTQEKARILTLLGYSARAQGRTDRAIAFHRQALEIARGAGDRPCEIANLNHLSRAYAAQGNYAEAIKYSQQAVIFSRQVGDRPGEANALANLGYSEVFQAQQLEQTEPEVYEAAIDYLRQGLQLSERLGDRQSQALCLSSLGIAHIVLEQAQTAIAYLEDGIQAAQLSGDLYLQGSNLSYLAEAYHHLQQPEQALYSACLGMYLLEQIGSTAWRQAAGLLIVLKGQLGDNRFQEILGQKRSQMIALIGVDGYDHIPQLLKQYQS
jgi:tetratricopeptide (TPR) repeat protein